MTGVIPVAQRSAYAPAQRSRALRPPGRRRQSDASGACSRTMVRSALLEPGTGWRGDDDRDGRRRSGWSTRRAGPANAPAHPEPPPNIVARRRLRRRPPVSIPLRHQGPKARATRRRGREQRAEGGRGDGEGQADDIGEGDLRGDRGGDIQDGNGDDRAIPELLDRVVSPPMCRLSSGSMRSWSVTPVTDTVRPDAVDRKAARPPARTAPRTSPRTPGRPPGEAAGVTGSARTPAPRARQVDPPGDPVDRREDVEGAEQGDHGDGRPAAARPSGLV